jgi:tetratricopeptide (TPR) repeat protein
MPRSLRSLIVSVLALWKGLSQKEIGAGAGLPEKRISYYLTKADLADDALFARLLRGVRGRPAEVRAVTACLESLAALEQDREMTPEEHDEVETGVLEGSRLLREVFSEAARRSRALPPSDRYPRAGDLDAARWHAGVLWKLLEPLAEDERLARVRETRDFQSWALAERLCEESVVQASRKVERAASLARLAQEIAARVRGPEGWRYRVQGFAAAHAANALRVAGELRQAEAVMEGAKRLWRSGSDPGQILDPGRLLDLEASLRRDQRRFEECLTLLEEALTVGRCPERSLLKKGFTLEVMGEYDRALETLLEAEPLVERRGDERLLYMLRFNLAVNSCHLGRYREAARLVRQVRGLVTERGDESELIRVVWLEGRIAAGLGLPEEGRSLLRQARREFAARKMGYDVALALLEEAVLLLEEGQTAEVRGVARHLAEVFESKGMHREVLAALRLFQEAAERDEATAELARRVLDYLFRARYDQGLRFTAA